MPFENNSYFARGAFQHRVITHQSLTSYDRAWDSTQQYPHPYPSSATIALRMEVGEDWYNDARHDLHLVNLLFQSRIQTAHWMSQRVDHFPNYEELYGVALDSNPLPCCAAFSDTGSWPWCNG